jgi:hypothetical protein
VIDNKVNAFQLPRMRLSETWDFDVKELLEGLQDSNLFFATFQDKKGNLKVLHTGFDENMYALMQTTVHRNIEVFDFMKLSLINAEKFRNGEWNEGFEIMTRAVEYIRIKNSKNLTL